MKNYTTLRAWIICFLDFDMATVFTAHNFARSITFYISML